MSIKQGNMMVSQYFTKVNSLCDEIQKTDAKSAITEARMCWIIIRGLDPKYSGLVTTTRGWATQPSLAELESILANQEDLDKQMSKVSIKDEENAFFTKRRAPQCQGTRVRRYNSIGESSGRRQPRGQQQHRWGPSRGGAHQARGEKEETDIAKKIDAINVARNDTLLETANSLKWNVM